MSESRESRKRIEAAIHEVLEGRVQDLRERLQTRWSEVLEESVAGLADPPELDDNLFPAAPSSGHADDVLARLHDAIRGLIGADDQVLLLNRLVDAAAGFAGRTALFVARRERAVGWTAAGLGGDAEPADIRQVTVPLKGNSPLARSVASGEPVQGSGDARSVWKALGVGASEHYLALPLRVKDRVVAVLFTDAGEAPSSAPLRPDALQILMRFAETHLTAVTLRARASSPGKGAVERRSSQAWEPAPAPAVEVEATLEPAEPVPEVVTPETVDGPSDPHEEARRFARLLVSEILLYNQSSVEEGRQNHDLSERLHADLDRSEQIYRQRVSAEITDGTDYFRQEVIRTLANGDSSLLGSG